MAAWFSKPENSFSNSFINPDCLSTCALDLLSKDIIPGGTLSFLISYQSWFYMHNAIPISFEDLVGVSGGGSQIRQFSCIWSLILKLQVSANVSEVASSLFNPSSPTFKRGRIGHFLDQPDSLLQEFKKYLPLSKLSSFGYVEDSPYSTSSIDYNSRLCACTL